MPMMFWEICKLNVFGLCGTVHDIHIIMFFSVPGHTFPLKHLVLFRLSLIILLNHKYLVVEISQNSNYHCMCHSLTYVLTLYMLN